MDNKGVSMFRTNKWGFISLANLFGVRKTRIFVDFIDGSVAAICNFVLNFQFMCGMLCDKKIREK